MGTKVESCIVCSLSQYHVHNITSANKGSQLGTANAIHFNNEDLLGKLELKLEILDVLLSEVVKSPNVNYGSTGSVEIGEVLRVRLSLHRVRCVQLTNHRSLRKNDLQSKILDLIKMKILSARRKHSTIKTF